MRIEIISLIDALRNRRSAMTFSPPSDNGQIAGEHNEGSRLQPINHLLEPSSHKGRAPAGRHSLGLTVHYSPTNRAIKRAVFSGAPSLTFVSTMTSRPLSGNVTFIALAPGMPPLCHMRRCPLSMPLTHPNA